MAIVVEQHDKTTETLPERLVAGFMRLPATRQKRVRAMLELLLHSNDIAEQMEIVGAILEIVAPDISGRKGSAQDTADLDEGVSISAKAKVKSHREYVGRQIAMKRAERGMTQEQLAEKSGLPQSHICRLETGKHTPTSLTIKKIADALEVSPESLDVTYEPDEEGAEE